MTEAKKTYLQSLEERAAKFLGAAKRLNVLRADGDGSKAEQAMLDVELAKLLVSLTARDSIRDVAEQVDQFNEFNATNSYNGARDRPRY